MSGSLRRRARIFFAAMSIGCSGGHASLDADVDVDVDVDDPQFLASIPPPSDLAVWSISDSQLDLTWVEHSSNEQGFTARIATNSGFVGATRRIVAPANDTTYSHTGLPAATTYWYAVRANGSGGSAWSAAACGTTAPTAIAAVPTGSTVVDVSWQGNGTNADVIGYTVRYDTVADFRNAVYRFVDRNDASAFRISELAPGQTFYIAVKAEGTCDSVFSPAVAVTTPGATLRGVPISPRFFGINAWMPYEIGDREYNGDLERYLCGAGFATGGECAPAEIAESGVQIMRYGGNGVDENWDDSKSLGQYLDMVDHMQANDIEPLLQVPYDGGEHDAARAEEIVRFINGPENHRGVRYWTVGNEPNLAYHYEDASGKDVPYDAAHVAAYFKPFVRAMKAVDPSILIVGPDPAWYDDRMIDELTNCGIPGVSEPSENDLTGFFEIDGELHTYVDIFAFHTYPFDGSVGHDDEKKDHTRDNVIAQPAVGFEENLVTLRERLAACDLVHGRAEETALKAAVTEANVDFDNPDGDGVNGVGAESFLGGQWWAETLSVGMRQGLELMTYWSVTEGNGLSYIGDNETKLSTYHHFKLLATTFRGAYVAGTHSVDDEPEPKVKVFAAVDHDQIAVMILNQRTTADFDYIVRLDGGAVDGPSGALEINVDVGVNEEYRSPVDQPIAAESTVLLVFDAAGNLRTRTVYSRKDHAESRMEPSQYTN